MNIKAIFLGVIFILGGCATMESLDHYYAEINWTDGISRNEAALIAKKWLVESQYAGDFQLLAPVSVGYDNLWRVSFLYKSLEYYEKVLDVYVDTLNGEIKASEIRHKDSPELTRNLWQEPRQDIP